MKSMKRIIILCLAAGCFVGCGIHKPYSRPEIETEELYGDVAGTAEEETIADLKWQELFTDAQLQELITLGLAENTDLQSAKLKIDEAHAALQSARLAYLPTINLAPQGNLASFNHVTPAKTYTLPVVASWQFDLFMGGISNQKRQVKAAYELSKEYEQAVRAQLIAGIANLYYTLLMLDEQVRVTEATADIWQEFVEKAKAMKEAGMFNEAAVAQYEATQQSVLSSLQDLLHTRTTVENSLNSVLARGPQTIARGKLADQQLSQNLAVGVPVEMLSNRPDVRIAEYSLMQAYFATNVARSALYPSISLSGTLGWTNNSGAGIVNPGDVIMNAAGSLLMPIFNARALQNQVKIAKAQQEEAMLAYKQTIINAGAEVNNVLSQCQSARAKRTLRANQVEAMRRAVESTELLMEHTSTTYLEVLTARQSLLSAELAQISDRFDELQGIVNLYQALGGGRE